MVYRYLRFCLEHGLIHVVVEKRGRGRYHSKDYDLSERGRRLLEIFEEQGAIESKGIKTW